MVEGAEGYSICRWVAVQFRDRVEYLWVPWTYVEQLEQDEGIIRARVATLDDLSVPSGRNFAISTVFVENEKVVESEKVAVVVQLPTSIRRTTWGAIKKKLGQ